MARRKKTFGKERKRPPFPWLLFLVFVATLLLFWALPQRLGSPPVRVEGIAPYVPDAVAPSSPVLDQPAVRDQPAVSAPSEPSPEASPPR